MKCSNSDCNKNISFFGKKIKCKGCKQIFCFNCSTRDPGEIEKLKKSGWCWACFIDKNEHSSIEKRTQDTVRNILG